MRPGPEQWRDLDRPPLDQRAIRRALGVGEPDSWWRRLTVVDATESTNADLAADAVAGAPEATVLVAEHQRAGRGRRGRTWLAPPRAALTLSVLVRPDVVPARWPWLPLLTGVATAEAVHRAARVDTAVKWPNDVLVGERKLAGVLLERVETPAGPAGVLGIGINVTSTRSELPVPTATSLALEDAGSADRHILLLTLLRTLQALYTRWTDGAGEDGAGGDDGTGLHASYVRRCRTLGQDVRVDLPDGTTVAGHADSVDTAGRLVLATATGRMALGAGDVVHVRPDPGLASSPDA